MAPRSSMLAIAVWVRASPMLASLMLAQTAPAHAEFYGGAQLGFERSDFEVANVNEIDSGFTGEIHAGFEYGFSPYWFTSLETYWGVRTTEVGTTRSIQRVGVQALLGRQMAGLVDVFVFAGPQWEQWQIQAPEEGPEDASVDNFLLGLRVGLGARYLFAPNWMMRAQYAYGRISTTYGGGNRGGGNNLLTHAHALTIGISYIY